MFLYKLLQGTYISTGLDVTYMQNYSVPKIFFYGKYKVNVEFKKNEGTVVGCMTSQINVLRPWEVSP